MINKKNKILITGGTGFIGLNLIKKLVEIGVENISVIVRKGSNIDQIKKIDSSINIYIVDILNKIKLAKVIKEIKPEIVYHLAAKGTKSTESNNTINSLIKFNGIGTINLIDTIKDVNTCVGFINISTIYEYGEKLEEINESMKIVPLGDYAISKSIGTLYATKTGIKNNFPIVTYRLTSVYGPTDKGRIIPFIIKSILNSEPITLYDVNIERDYIYIDDVINALLNINKALIIPGDIINIGSGKAITIKDIIEIIESQIGINLKKVNTNLDSIHKSHCKINNNYMIEKLNISITPFNEGIKHTINYFKNNK